MDNGEILLNLKVKTKDDYPMDYTASIIDQLLTSRHLKSKLDWNPKFCLFDHIDNIRPEDLTVPIMWGLDESQRLFVAIRTRMNDNHKLVVETFFQRYTYGKMWVSASNSPHYFDGQCVVKVVYCSLADKDTSAYQNFLNLLRRGYTEMERVISADERIRCQLTVI